jgi:predicted DNA-binding WGR domain protein
MIILDHCDSTRNMARYYVLSTEPSLFGDTALVR